MRARLWQLCRKYAFAVVPAIGLWELGAHFVQIHSAPTDEQWRAARTAVEPLIRASDLLIFAPEWVEPLGREYFGDRLASIARIARPDESRFPRAIEVSIRGAERPELRSWRVAQRERLGPFEIETLENPEPATILTDLVERVGPSTLAVSLVSGDHETPCAWTHAPALSGGLGYGPSLPEDRFSCPGGKQVALTVISDPNYESRRCIYAPPVGGASVLRLRFRSILFGRVFHGHHAIPAEADHANGAPVTVVFRTDAGVLGSFTRRDGSGWTAFETQTPELQGKTMDLMVDITAADPDRRQYCFEADTR